MQELGETYRWAMEMPIGELAQTIASAADEPLIAIGSGGSRSAASFAAALHAHYTGRVAVAATPLDIQRRDILAGRTWYLIITAGGNNHDILATFRHLVAKDASRITLLTATQKSRISKLASRYAWIDQHEFVVPNSDGFLATNSLLSFCILLIRGYLAVFDPRTRLPPSIDRIPAISRLGRRAGKLAELCKPLWERSSLVVLHSASLVPAAVDLESKFTEAALGTTMASDFRHFGHGRHHWLAKKGDETAVLALIDDADADLAKKTLDVLPTSIPRVALSSPGTISTSMLGALVLAMQIAGLAGADRGIDPGRPGVPMFGRRLYRLRAGNSQPLARRHIQNVAVTRKIIASERTIFSVQQQRFWEVAYRDFGKKLSRSPFGAIVFDYDGTLCDRCDRLKGLQPRVVNSLKKLLAKEIPIGLATGRGGSVQRVLRDSLSEEFWDLVIVGYYNGSQVAPLSATTGPTRDDCCAELGAVHSALVGNTRLRQLINTIEPRGQQISLQPVGAIPPFVFRAIVKEIVETAGAAHLRVVWSTHSVDVLAPGVSKCAVLDNLRVRFPSDLPILTIGDLGAAPGNDYQLLAEPYSLSVDQISSSVTTCWNLAPPGVRGASATLSYLNAMTLHRGCLTVNIDDIRQPRL